MRAGDLVRIKRASIGVPMDTLGLLTERLKDFGSVAPGHPREELEALWQVQLLHAGLIRVRRYMSRDLEVVNGNR